ncbi:MAG: ABC transporter permease [Planctomycetaceae bacterium]|jgi:hypothetical protein|nr:ABC transporter permease [Planctomycetaceae bacterium]
MPTQFIAILKKEFRQQSPLAAAMLLLCFIIQLGAFTMAMFSKIFGQIEPSFLGIALLATALYAGAAAAVSFSVEHEEKTFGFLRSLPVSPLTMMFAKAVWVVTGTILVLISSLILASFWILNGLTDFLPEDIVQLGKTDLWLSLGVGIIEVTVWGFFWSPLCRKQIHAVLAAYSCAALVSFFTVQIFAQNTGILNAYEKAAPLRLGITVIVGMAAVFSMLRWFKNTAEKNRTAESLTHFTHKNIAFCCQPIPKTPFMTLFCQSMRQSQLLLFWGGVLATICLSCILIYVFFHRYPNDFMKTILLGANILFMIIFSGSIFGMDQGNQSFRFLSRCGISPGKIWWSRILPFLFVYIPSLIVIIAIEMIFHYQYNLDENDLYFAVSHTIPAWLIPFSVGAFFSIYCRSMLVSVSLTGAVSLLLFFWMCLGVTLCRFNPLWTTLPPAAALLVASRLRTADWLRERQTWNNLLKPLIPFFITITIIIFAIPFVRIYSIPYISLEEVEAMLDETVLAERLSPKERKKMFQETAARLTQKFNEKDINQIELWHQSIYRYHTLLRYNNIMSVLVNVNAIKSGNDEALKIKALKKEYAQSKETLQSFPLFETWLLYHYEMQIRIVHGGREHILPAFTDTEKVILTRFHYLPWEKTRMLRILNWQLGRQITLVYDDNKKQSPHDDAAYFSNVNKKYERVERLIYHHSGESLIPFPGEWSLATGYFEVVIGNRLRLVYLALSLWYLEHDHTLPESLDELVGTYLDEIPRDPRTGTIMEYYPQGNDSLNIPNDSSRYRYHKPNRPYLKLEGYILDLHFVSKSQ